MRLNRETNEGDVADEDVGIVVLTEDDADDTDELAVFDGGGATLALAAVTGDIKQRLIDFQKAFVAPLVANFDRRIKIPISASKLQRLCDFRKMPFGRGDSELTTGLLLSYGNEEADWIVANIFPELSALN